MNKCVRCELGRRGPGRESFIGLRTIATKHATGDAGTRFTWFVCEECGGEWTLVNDRVTRILSNGHLSQRLAARVRV